MRFSNALKMPNPFARLRRLRAFASLRPAREMREIIGRERSRSDRTGHEFSLVVFRIAYKGATLSLQERLVLILEQRVRSTDEIGWFDQKSVCVILPHTPAPGALVFANQVRSALQQTATVPKTTVYTYPSSSSAFHDGPNRAQAETCVCPECGARIALEAQGAKREAALRRFSAFAVLPAGPGVAEGEEAGNDGLESLLVRRLPIWKRAIDLVGACVGVLVFLPTMAIVAALIKFTSRGPVFFRQKRGGLGGKPFTLYKFRSMVVDADKRKAELMKFNERGGPVFKMTNDPRVTPVGRFIRQWSLDELPQFFNVFVGDMSLVGPRPPTLDEVEKYSAWQDERLHVKPGITCLWQVTARHDSNFEKWVRLDIEYVRRRSFMLDMKILARTVPAVLSRRGAV